MLHSSCMESICSSWQVKGPMENHHFFQKEADRKGATCYFSGPIKVNSQCHWEINEHWINLHPDSIYLNDLGKKNLLLSWFGIIIKIWINYESNRYYHTNVKSQPRHSSKKKNYPSWHFLCNHMYKLCIDLYRKAKWMDVVTHVCILKPSNYVYATF